MPSLRRWRRAGIDHLFAKLNAEIRRTLDLADIRDRFKMLGGEPQPRSAEASQAFVAGESRKWQNVVSARGIERQ
jgi:hypothetical protein